MKLDKIDEMIFFQILHKRQHRTMILERREANEGSPTTANLLSRGGFQATVQEGVAPEPGSTSDLRRHRLEFGEAKKAEFEGQGAGEEGDAWKAESSGESTAMTL